jgi:ubiquinone/menaquinone biosynthesis C-methylase UbiE
MDTQKNELWFPKAIAGERPTPWWYYGRAIFVSRHDYRKIFFKFLMVGIPLGLIGLFMGSQLAWILAFVTGGIGVTMLILSLTGLYLQYGHYAKNYFSRMLHLEPMQGKVVLADIHIGTYRHSYILSEQLPGATVYSVDCKREPKFSEELAVREVQELETPPTNENITTIYTSSMEIPLETNSCDAVVFGFGTHEIPEGKERDKIFDEAKRILKPGGKLFLFEHGIDFVNYLIFGPVIYHVTKRESWKQLLTAKFTQVKLDRLYAVNLFSATNNK